MNRKILVLGLMMAAFGATAQVSLVNPVPQEVVANKDAVLIDAPQQWALNADAKRLKGYVYDALLTASPEVSEKAAFKVVIGVRGDKNVRSYNKSIPAKSEGYFMKVTDKEVVIAGNDEKGLFYGVQTLLGMMQNGKLELCTITDWPDVPFRGTVEGFYGTPWSHEARKSQLEFYGRNKMNVYIYGPKDDPWHRDKWREPYPEVEANRIGELVDVAKKNGVNFYWAIHPGVDIKWNDEDRDKLMAKLEVMYQLGVRSFAVFFDDIWGEGAQADKQAALLNYIDDNFVQAKKDVAPLILCPTEYNKGWANEEKGYLRTLGKNLNKGIEVNLYSVEKGILFPDTWFDYIETFGYSYNGIAYDMCKYTIVHLNGKLNVINRYGRIMFDKWFDIGHVNSENEAIVGILKSDQLKGLQDYNEDYSYNPEKYTLYKIDKYGKIRQLT